MKKTVFCLALTAFILLLSVSCTTMNDILTTVPNMRAEAAAAEKEQAELEAKRAEEQKREAMRQEIQAELLAQQQSSAPEIPVQPEPPASMPEVSVSEAPVTPNFVDSLICGNNIKFTLIDERTIEIVYSEPVSPYIEKMAVSFVTDSYKSFLEDSKIEYTADGLRVSLSEPVSSEIFVSRVPVVMAALDIYLSSQAEKNKAETQQAESVSEIQPVPVQEEPEIKEEIKTTEKQVQEVQQDITTPDSWQSDVQAVPVYQKSEDNSSRQTKAPVPANETVNSRKATTKPPALDRQGIGLLIIVIAIAVTSAMIVYFVLLRKKNN